MSAPGLGVGITRLVRRGQLPVARVGEPVSTAEQHGTLSSPPASVILRRLSFMVRRSFIALLIASLLLPASAVAESSGWQILLGGDDANTPRMPSGVAVDAAGRIYVVDTGGSRLEQLAPSGRVVATIGRLGTGDDGLRRPRGITLDRQGVLFVADTANHRVQRFSAH